MSPCQQRRSAVRILKFVFRVDTKWEKKISVLTLLHFSLVGEKKFLEFSRLFQSHKLLHRLSQQKVNVKMTFIKGEPAADVLPTAVLHKYLNDELKILCLLQFFFEVAPSPRIPQVFHVQRNP